MSGKKLHWDMIPSVWQGQIIRTASKSQLHRSRAINNFHQGELYERYTVTRKLDDLGLVSAIKAMYHMTVSGRQDKKNALTIKGLMQMIVVKWNGKLFQA